MTTTLIDGYEVREMSQKDFGVYFVPLAKTIFGEIRQFDWQQTITAEDAPKVKDLRNRAGTPHVLRLGVFHGDDFVGWHIGHQKNDDGTTFYMQNSAIIEGHRRKGLYGALLDYVLKYVDEMGYQTVFSRHHMTNNAVLIPKLQRGFIITSFEVSDRFGTLIQLTRFKNESRKKVLEYRIGRIDLDDELDALLSRQDSHKTSLD